MPTAAKKRLMPGTVVYHDRYGAGTVLREWGPVLEAGREVGMTFRSSPGTGIYDVAFTNPSGVQYLHCCRTEFLMEPFKKVAEKKKSTRRK